MMTEKTSVPRGCILRLPTGYLAARTGLFHTTNFAVVKMMRVTAASRGARDTMSVCTVAVCALTPASAVSSLTEQV